MSAAGGQRLILITSASPDDRLASELKVLTEGYSASSIQHIVVPAVSRGRSPLPVVDVVASAAYLIVQEPAHELPPEHIAAVAVAQSNAVPMLLICPSSPAASSLSLIADAPPSQIIKYPERADDKEAWSAFQASLKGRKEQIRSYYERAQRVAYLRPIIQRLGNVSKTLTDAAPDEHIARIVASAYDSHLNEVTVEEHVDCLQMDLPATQYPYLLSQLTGTFPLVRTIADPSTEELPWDDPVDSSHLSTVSERTFIIDEEHAKLYGIESVLEQVSLGVLSRGGVVSIAGLDENLQSQIRLASTANQRLFGLNRFYAGDSETCKIIGGYGDETGARVRLLACRDVDQAVGTYGHELNLLSMVDAKKKPLPIEASRDLTTLASWVYSNVLTTPSLSSIYFREKPAYADEYDGNIVRVTPGYFTQLDATANEVFLSLIAQYSPTIEQSGLRILELGFGTGTLTGRLLKISSQFMALMKDQRSLIRPFVELDGWDSNSRMVQIATERLNAWLGSLKDTVPIQPNLMHVDFNAVPPEIRKRSAKYDLIVGSLFYHYWIDLGPDGAATSPDHLHEFRRFLERVRSYVKVGGDVIFLDVAYSPEGRGKEQGRWRKYVASELDSDDHAGQYFDNNQRQYYAPSTDVISAAAKAAGFHPSWHEALPGFPFRILHLKTEPEIPQGDER